jgi:hypothetical protein
MDRGSQPIEALTPGACAALTAGLSADILILPLDRTD